MFFIEEQKINDAKLTSTASYLMMLEDYMANAKTELAKKRGQVAICNTMNEPPRIITENSELEEWRKRWDI